VTGQNNPSPDKLEIQNKLSQHIRKQQQQQQQQQLRSVNLN